MPRFRLSRRHVAAVAMAAAMGCASLPAPAAPPTQVEFKAGSAWAQEVGSVKRYDNERYYTVAVGADKTLQINLVTRDPNLFFTVRNDSERKDLVDTIKTGATSWTTQNATAANYTIRVYVQPEAMQRGEVAEYALQIGQYGAADMQPATTTVTFPGNNPWAQEVSSVDANATAHDYTVALTAGKTLQVNLVTRDAKVHFKVKDQASGTELVDTRTSGATTWSTPVTTAATYTIQVYIDPADMPPGHAAVQYALQIGHYPSTEAQSAPAAAGSAVAPATPSTTGTPATAASSGR